jgi:hypothetical protein
MQPQNRGGRGREGRGGCALEFLGEGKKEGRERKGGGREGERKGMERRWGEDRREKLSGGQEEGRVGERKQKLEGEGSRGLAASFLEVERIHECIVHHVPYKIS